MSTREIFFFIGTEAELIKVFPVMTALDARGLPCKIIASGQNDITQSAVLAAMNDRKPDLQLSREQDIVKSSAGLLRWFFKTRKTAAQKIRQAYPQADFSRAIMVIHGDTISTVMGAMVGKKMGMTVAHVEAGMRSRSIFSPFPEEIDRILADRLSAVCFAPEADAVRRLKKKKCEVVDTRYNTIIDSLAYSRSVPCKDGQVNAMLGRDYFVFVFHRQENLMNKALLKNMTERVVALSRQKQCVFVMHTPTRVALQGIGLYGAVANCPGIEIIPRTEYFDFMKLLYGCRYVLTDGGSNQEELGYMGKPCMVLRSRTERELKKNAQLFCGDFARLDSFVQNYESFAIEPTAPEISPAAIIADKLAEMCR